MGLICGTSLVQSNVAIKVNRYAIGDRLDVPELDSVFVKPLSVEVMSKRLFGNSWKIFFALYRGGLCECSSLGAQYLVFQCDDAGFLLETHVEEDTIVSSVLLL